MHDAQTLPDLLRTPRAEEQEIAFYNKYKSYYSYGMYVARKI